MQRLAGPGPVLLPAVLCIFVSACSLLSSELLLLNAVVLEHLSAVLSLQNNISLYNIHLFLLLLGRLPNQQSARTADCCSGMRHHSESPFQELF